MIRPAKRVLTAQDVSGAQAHRRRGRNARRMGALAMARACAELPTELPLPVAEPPQLPALPSPQRYDAESLAISSLNSITAKQRHPHPVEIVEPSLPSELLHAIFTSALEPSSSDIDFEEKTILRITIFSCAQVCQQWRFAARDCRALWPNGIDFQRQAPQVIADLLQLSHPHPIDVGHRTVPFCIASERDLAVIDLLKIESCRIREWNVELSRASDRRRSSRGWAFYRGRDRPSVTSLRHTGDFALSPWCLQDLSPTLKKLSIRDNLLFERIHPTMQFPALTELHVSNVPTYCRPLDTEWFNALRNMPRLQLLALHNVIHHSDPGDLLASSGSSLWVSQLRFLSIRSDDWGGILAGAMLVRVLQIPASCGMELGFPSPSIFVQFQGFFAGFVTFHRSFVRQLISGGNSNLTSADVPQIEIGLRSTKNRCHLSFGTVRDAHLTLDWNGERGTRGVVEYLDAHTSAFPKFPPLNITFNNAVATDLAPAFEIMRDVFSRAQSVRIHVEAGRSSNRSVELVAAALPSYLSQVRSINVLKLGRGSSNILNELRTLESPSARPLPSAAPSLTSPARKPVLPNLRRIVLEIGEETAGWDGGMTPNDADLEQIREYAAWRTKHGFPIEVVVH